VRLKKIGGWYDLPLPYLNNKTMLIINEPLKDVTNLTRDQVVPYYRHLILNAVSDEEVKRVNQLILSKWKVSGLIYIKEKAWKGNERRFYVDFPNDLPLPR
jgi:hypothetical protein